MTVTTALLQWLTRTRRGFLGRVAKTIAAAQLGMTSVVRAQTTTQSRLRCAVAGPGTPVLSPGSVA